jgi:hypothetical protein
LRLILSSPDAVITTICTACWARLFLIHLLSRRCNSPRPCT